MLKFVRTYTIVILLILTFATPFYGSWYVYMGQKEIIRHRAIQQIVSGTEAQKLAPLKFLQQRANSLIWEHADVFESNGVMYNVVTPQQIGNTIHRWCFCDSKETKLKAILKKTMIEQTTSNGIDKWQVRLLTNFTESLYFNQIFQFSSTSFCQLCISSPYTHYFTIIFFDIPSPPPKQARRYVFTPRDYMSKLTSRT